MQENEKTILTDEELETLTNSLEKNASDSEDTKAIREAKKRLEEMEEELKLEDGGMVDVVPNENTGEVVLTEVQEQYKDTDSSLSEIAEGKLDEKNTENFNNNLKNSISTQFDIPDEEIKELISVIMRYRSGESFSVYNALPETVKKFVNVMAMELGTPRDKYNMIAKSVLDQFIAEANIDQEFIDFQKALEKELEIPNMIDMYSEHNKERMEVTILESADKLQEQYPEKAEMLRQVSKTFTETYKFTRLKDCLANDPKVMRKLRRSKTLYKRYCDEFNYKNKDSQYKINDIYMVGKVLNKVLPSDILVDDIYKFVTLFCKTCEDLNPNDVVDCAYMYYFIKNIIMLEYADEAKTEFSKELISNIINMINEINEAELKEEENNPDLKNKKKKKK